MHLVPTSAFRKPDRTVHVVTYDAPYGDILINKHTEYVLCR
ncbi:hypothetical protein HMPREF9552_04385 [Escherichia coli MS 198-1]|nr:hypothetical protein HMPREF9551_00632 [Escherichia coli MS 196-1]EFJ72004.1 hypothetical protein HMPREF9552_04385 [Escherichia coli MS 198-1]EFK90060.1 hypothetical protein HMPREF9543_03127 [Escherichia coli MS 146-1]EFO57952.1 hypothetical protein HMPREF9348_02779 [Escherichia coli MS 145-7]ESA76457.1 hypothetical protein HMPREF1589_00485 [Escherichia coli 113290]ESA94808.1 hypothetical protein HMPREF1599_00524 [Escherichia coli 907713]ESD55332.1 hypothetical protein HMPREF1606_02802 [Esc